MIKQNLPCPFCGCEPYVTSSGLLQCDNGKCAFIGCLPTKIWNIRPPHPLEQKIDEFRVFLKHIKPGYDNDDLFNQGYCFLRDKIKIQFNFIFGKSK